MHDGSSIQFAGYTLLQLAVADLEDAFHLFARLSKNQASLPRFVAASAKLSQHTREQGAP
jgi:hypothetical protein